MPYPLGAQVRVRTIGKVGRVVAVARGGRYRVLVGGIEVVCRAEELETPGAAAPARKKRPSVPPSHRAGAEHPSAADCERLGTIDLHGATVDEALRAVETRLDEAILAGLGHLDIIHGLGTGRVRLAVHHLLRGIGAVRHFELMPRNPGVTRAYF